MKELIMALLVSMIIGFLPAVTLAEELTDTIKYSIRPGDTFHLLSIRFNTTIDNIAHLNKRTNPSNLLVGQKIIIPVGKDVLVHNIVNGDTLWKLSEKYNSTVDTITAQNYIKDPSLIYTRDILAIPKEKKVVWLSGQWRDSPRAGDVTQADYDGAYALYNSVSEEELDDLMKKINDSLPRAFDEEGNTLPNISNPRVRLWEDEKGQWNLLITHITTRMGNYGWVTGFSGTLNTNKEGFTNGVPVDVQKFAKALYVYKLRR